MNPKFQKWLLALIKTVVGGAATAGASFLGVGTAKSLGVDVPAMNIKQLGIVLAVASVSNLFFYLSKNPIWDDSNGDTPSTNPPGAS